MPNDIVFIKDDSLDKIDVVDTRQLPVSKIEIVDSSARIEHPKRLSIRSKVSKDFELTNKNNPRPKTKIKRVDNCLNPAINSRLKTKRISDPRKEALRKLKESVENYSKNVDRRSSPTGYESTFGHISERL